MLVRAAGLDVMEDVWDVEETAPPVEEGVGQNVALDVLRVA